MRRSLLFALIGCFAASAALAYDFGPLKPLDQKGVDPALFKDIYGGWEIRDKSGKKRCRIDLLKEPAIGGLGIEVAPGCAKAFPVMDDIAGWRLMENWTIDLIDALRHVRVRFETPDNRYVAFGAATDIAGIDGLRKLPDSSGKKGK